LDELFPSFQTLKINQGLLDLRAPLVMGILNATPDSFYVGSRVSQMDETLALAARMVQEGAKMLDLGGHSTRPGATSVSPQEEMDRVLPFIERIIKEFPDIIVSVDTYRLAVAQAAFAAGAGLWNDIGGGNMDEGVFDWVIEHQVPYVLSHSVGRFSEVHQVPDYADVVQDVWLDLQGKVDYFRSRGHRDLLIDPGFGFSKSLDHNYALLASLNSFTRLGAPVLVGLSRKTMIWKYLEISADQALNGTTALHAIAIAQGASILRVHDVKEAMEVIALGTKLKQHGLSNIY
jgi:dihydropteroate synthase